MKIKYLFLKNKPEWWDQKSALKYYLFWLPLLPLRTIHIKARRNIKLFYWGRIMELENHLKQEIKRMEDKNV